MSLPYWNLPSIPLFGPLQIQPFGVMVAIGVLAGVSMSWRKARSMGVDEDSHRSFIGWLLITGFVGAHILEVLLYEPDKIARDPLVLLRVWEGISSYGGLFGAVIGFVYFTHTRGVSKLAWGDIAAWGIVPGWIFGRAGCAIVHDHPGRLSDFPLAIDFPRDAPYVVQQLQLQPGPRHDLGFYEFLYWILLFGALYAVTRKPRPAGFVLAFVALAYAPVRFALEYLRIVDPRTLGLTPAQYASIAAFVIGIVLMVAAYRQKDREHRVVPASAKEGGASGADRDSRGGKRHSGGGRSGSGSSRHKPSRKR